MVKGIQNPPCPKCGGLTNKNGKTAANSQRYRCKSCGFSFTPENPVRGAKAKGEKAATATERVRKHRASLTPQQKTIARVKEVKRRRDARRRKASEETRRQGSQSPSPEPR